MELFVFVSKLNSVKCVLLQEIEKLSADGTLKTIF